MTKEELEKRMKEQKEKMQNEFIDKLLEQVEWLNEKANRKDYETTTHEQEVLSKICSIVNNMKTWF